MKDLLVSGARLMTTGAVADALLAYAVELTVHHGVAVARFPAVIEGQHVDTQMVIGTGVPLTAVSVDPVLPLDLDGADFAAARIRARTSALSRKASTD